MGQHQDRGTSSAWYDRAAHSEWSQLGKMVQDVSAAVDFLLAPSMRTGHPFHSGNWSVAVHPVICGKDTGGARGAKVVIWGKCKVRARI